MPSKDAPAVIARTMEGLQKMKAKPKIIYSDDEGSLNSGDFNSFVEGEGIELYKTKFHPAFAERFVRTFKDMFFKRVEANEKTEG